jgi:hypothetical protein
MVLDHYPLEKRGGKLLIYLLLKTINSFFQRKRKRLSGTVLTTWKQSPDRVSMAVNS